MGRPMAYSTIAAVDTANSRHLTGVLAEIATRNLKTKRQRQRAQTAARIAHANLRPAPGTLGETKRPCHIPVTFKAEPKRRRVERPATSTAPESVKAEPVHEPIKAAELSKDMREAAKRIMAADESGTWRVVGVMDHENRRVTVYVRKHGRSARYSVAAI